MNKLEKTLFEVCGNNIQTFERVRVEVFGLLKDPEAFENVEIEFSFGDNLSPRVRKDLEILDLETFNFVSKFLQRIGFKPIRKDEFEHYQTQYFKK